MTDQGRHYSEETVAELRKQVDGLRRGWKELSEEVEQLKRERDEAREAIDKVFTLIVTASGNATGMHMRMLKWAMDHVDLAPDGYPAHIEGGQDDT